MPQPVDVSIVIPAYKADWFIPCLESCLQQTVAVKEIIISDDCPSDAIEKLVAPYLQDSRIRYVRNVPSLGLAANYLQLARMSSATWLKFFDDDDLLHPDGVEKLFRHVSSEVSLVMGGCLMLRENGESLQKLEKLPPVSDGLAYFFSTYRKTPITLFSRMLVRRDVMECLLAERVPPRMISLDELVGLYACLMGNIAWEESLVCTHRDFSGGYSRNVEPDVLIDDLAYVTTPYAYAVSHNIASIGRLRRWRSVMVKKYARGVLTKFIQQKNSRGLWAFMALLQKQFGYRLALRCGFSPRLIIRYCKHFF